jgi:hypothetical protein
MTQADLDLFHETITGAVQVWADQLITDMELAMYIAKLTVPTDAALAGLIDPNSGLRYDSAMNQLLTDKSQSYLAA